MSGNSVEEYLEAIYSFNEKGHLAKNSELAKRLKVAPPSVTQMVQKLAEEGLVEYEPYRGTLLTGKGTALAQKVVRKHRLLERFLHDVLGLDLDKVHEEACRMEHGLSDEAAAALTSLPGIRLISQRVSDRPVFRDSFSEGLAVFELEPRSKAAAEFVGLATALFGEKRSFGRRRPRTGRARAAAIAMQREVLADLYGNGGDADRDSPADRADMDGQTSDAAGQHWADETERGAKGKKKHKGGKKRLKEHKTKHKGSGKKGKKDKEGKKGKKAKKNKKGKRR